MAGAVPNERLREYLRELKPEARALLVSELERARLRGDSPPGAFFVLEALHQDARNHGGSLPRIGNPQRLFFSPTEPFLVDDDPARKHRGRIPRASLNAIWGWISRDLMPQEAKAYSDQVQLLLAANQTDRAEEAARAFQGLTEQRIHDCLAANKSEERERRLAGQIGTPNGLDEVRELGAILRVRDALGVIASRLPAGISNLGGAQLENVKALLNAPVARQRDVFLYSLIVVISRLGSPWQLVRLAIDAASSDSAARIAETPFAVAVDVVLDDLDRMIARLEYTLKAGSSEEVEVSLKDLHDAVRGLRTEMDFGGDSAWARRLAAARAETARLINAEIENLPGQVRRLLRAPTARDERAGTVLDAGDVDDVEARLGLAAACRNYASELAVSEATHRVHSDLETWFDSSMQILLDRLRAAPPAQRSFRQSQVDAAVRFCGKLFGAGYAGLLAKAADMAAKDEQKLAKA